MAIIRVNIVTERARFCKVFTDEAQAIKETDAFLFENKLNDGCSLISCEDFIALNAVLADLFDDIYNADNFAQWEDIEKELLEYLQKNITHQDRMQPGTVSRATLLEKDICTACLQAIYSVDQDRAKKLLHDEPEMAAAIYDELIFHTENEWWQTEDAFLIMAEDLTDIMEQYAPEGHYFGAHEGDGSDFGYWPNDDCEDYE